MEVLVSVALAVVAFVAFYAASGQAIRVVMAGRETAVSTQLLQQRVEAMKMESRWDTFLSPAEFEEVVENTVLATANLPGAVESYTVTAYPPGTEAFTVTRNAAGKVSNSGKALPDSVRCVRVSGQVSWTGAGKRARTQTRVALLRKGGL